MSYDYYLDLQDERNCAEDYYCDDCGHMECQCQDTYGDTDDFDSDDYEVVFDGETGELEVVQ